WGLPESHSRPGFSARQGMGTLDSPTLLAPEPCAILPGVRACLFAMVASVSGLGGCGTSSPPARADAASADTRAGLPFCQLGFSKSTANMVAPEMPVTGSCPGERTDDGMGHPFIDFQPVDMQGGVVRTFSIWQFETRAASGTVLKAEDGYDELASRGVSVRYLEVSGSRTKTWRADQGAVTRA